MITTIKQTTHRFSVLWTSSESAFQGTKLPSNARYPTLLPSLFSLSSLVQEPPEFLAFTWPGKEEDLDVGWSSADMFPEVIGLLQMFGEMLYLILSDGVWLNMSEDISVWWGSLCWGSSASRVHLIPVFSLLEISSPELFMDPELTVAAGQTGADRADGLIN